MLRSSRLLHQRSWQAFRVANLVWRLEVSTLFALMQRTLQLQNTDIAVQCRTYVTSCCDYGMDAVSHLSESTSTTGFT